MPYTPDGFQWECPAHALAAVDGNSFVADIDLGFHVTLRALVVADGIEPLPTEYIRARREAHRLIRDADLFLRTLRIATQGAGGRYRVLAEVHYSPFFTPRSEQASFAAAMLASGYARATGNRG